MATEVAGTLTLDPGDSLVGMPLLEETGVTNLGELLSYLGDATTLFSIEHPEVGSGPVAGCGFAPDGSLTGDGCSTPVQTGQAWLIHVIAPPAPIAFSADIECPAHDLQPGANAISRPCAADGLTTHALALGLWTAGVEPVLSWLDTDCGCWRTVARDGDEIDDWAGPDVPVANTRGFIVGVDTPLVYSDRDGDGLSDDYEFQIGTDPDLADSDADDLLDGQELLIGLDPTDPDTDFDGLNDGAEYFVHHTDPLNHDTDGDGFNDGDEVGDGADPLDPASIPQSLWSQPILGATVSIWNAAAPSDGSFNFAVTGFSIYNPGGGTDPPDWTFHHAVVPSFSILNVGPGEIFDYGYAEAPVFSVLNVGGLQDLGSTAGQTFSLFNGAIELENRAIAPVFSVEQLFDDGGAE